MHRIAVYGSLRQGEYNYRRAQGDPICTGKIHKAQLYSLGAYPCIVASDDEADEVVVEVYDIDDKLFIGIEAMELGAGYQRLPVKVWWEDIQHDHNGDGNPLDAEAYFFPDTRDWFGPRVASGDWLKRKENDNADT